MNEYGVDTSMQSALNLVYMLGLQDRTVSRGGRMNVLGYSDQRFTIATAINICPSRSPASLPAGSIAVRPPLAGDPQTPARRLRTALLDRRTERAPRYFDRVVLAIPFIALRGVDYSGTPASTARKNERDRQNSATAMHTKLHVQFHGRPWTRHGAWPAPIDGQIWTDTAVFRTRSIFRSGQHGAQRNPRAIHGGNGRPDRHCRRCRTQESVIRRPSIGTCKRFFAQLDAIWPGISRSWNGKATFGNAQADPNIQASYSCWLVGQYTKFAGYEGVRQGRVHFAGEHCSVNNQGFMEGGAETGVAAAREILADYGVRVTA